MSHQFLLVALSLYEPSLREGWGYMALVRGWVGPIKVIWGEMVYRGSWSLELWKIRS